MPQEPGQAQEGDARALATTDGPPGPIGMVGIGASAGGLSAVRRLVAGLRPGTGLAYLVVQHMPPDAASKLDELLQKTCALPVRWAEHGAPIAPDTVYVNPPGRYIDLEAGAFVLREAVLVRRMRMPIDHFFVALAAAFEDRAVAIVMTGADSDGAVGIKGVKERGGLVVAQDPETAEHGSMPRSAVDTGTVDALLEPEAMGPFLGHYAKTYLGPDAEAVEAREPDGFGEVLALLRERCRHDFRPYRHGPLLRRLQRRMALRGSLTIRAYLDALRRDERERAALYHDFLVNVTRFFRDPEVFEAIAERVLPALIDRASLSPEPPLRLWVPGCASGEEAYSLAIVLAEQLLRRDLPLDVRLIATDVDVEALRLARDAHYPELIIHEVSEERLRRFFTREANGFRVVQTIRDMVVFERHNVLTDAAYARLAMISCRNLLRYLQPAARHAVLARFHEALDAHGVLVLGTQEAAELDGFAPMGRSAHLYWRLDAAPRPSPTRPATHSSS